VAAARVVGRVGQLAVQVAVGAVLVPDQLAMKPNVVDAAGARLPFQDSFRTVTVAPLVVCTPPQSWVTC
jgi:hypothetical protein